MGDENLNSYVSGGTYLDTSKYKIPKEMIKVFLKMCPEIDEVETISVNYNKLINPYDFNPVYKFLICVKLYVKPRTTYRGSGTYKDILSDCMKTMFPNIEDVHFFVENWVMLQEVSQFDRFKEVFYVGE
jgi:hypothetical protein